MNSNATKMPKSHEIERKWYVVDAEGKVLGRLATEVANILRGKNKPYFAPHVDCGDFVIDPPSNVYPNSPSGGHRLLGLRWLACVLPHFYLFNVIRNLQQFFHACHALFYQLDQTLAEAGGFVACRHVLIDILDGGLAGNHVPYGFVDG